MMSRPRPRRRPRRSVHRAAAEALEFRTLLAFGLDPSFDGGVVESFVGDTNVHGIEVALAPDGDLIVAAEQTIARHNPDGSFDPAFGVNGIVRPPTTLAFIDALELQRDGKILVAGRDAASQFAVERYLPSGAIDTSLSGDGSVTVTFGSGFTQGFAHDIALTENGFVVVGAAVNPQTGERRVGLARFPSTNVTSPAIPGIADNVTAQADEAFEVDVAPDGKIVVAAHAHPGTPGDSPDQLVLLRYTASGARDLSFNGTGFLTRDLSPTFDRPRGLDIQPDGRILVSGAGNLLRFTTAGQPDLTFGGGDGVVPSAIFDLPNSTATYFTGVLVDPTNGRILVTGGVEEENGARAYDATARLHPDGSIDATFTANGAGRIINTFGFRSGGRDLLIQPDGKIVMAGEYESYNARLLRLAPSGTQTAFKPHTTNQLIQAEDFDTGGQDVAYNDLEPANRGSSAYRPGEGVDLGTNGVLTAINFTAAGEWTECTVNVPVAGLYTFTTRIANNSAGAQFHFDVDGVNATGPLDVPNTGSFGAYQDVRKTGVQLAAGTHVIRLSEDRGATANGAIGNIDYFHIDLEQSQTPGQSPFLARPFLAGERIQVEDFDTGGPGVAYNDADVTNRGGQYRLNEQVDIGGGGTGTVIGYVVPGEWLEYTVQVAQAGQYRFTLAAANNAAGGSVHVEANGQNVTGPIAIPNTGSFGTFQEVTSKVVNLPAGTYVIRLAMDQASPVNGAVGNLDYLRFDRVQTAGPAAPTNLRLAENTPRSVTIEWDSDVAGVQSYAVYRNGQRYFSVSPASSPATKTGFQDNNVQPGQTYTYTVRAVDAAGVESPDSNPVTVTTPTAPPQGPFGGTPRTTGQAIQVEDFDTGGEGVAYHDADVTNRGGQYRLSESVDIGGGGTGTVIGHVVPGEWLEYTVTVPQDGDYRFTLSAANNAVGGIVHFELPSRAYNLTGPIAIPNTGSFGTFQTVTSAPGYLEEGTHVIRLVADTAAANGAVGNLDFFRFNFDLVRAPAAPQNLTAPRVEPRSVTIEWDAVPDATGYQVFRDGEVVAFNVTNDSAAARVRFTDGNAHLVEPGTTYTYTVRASNRMGFSPFSGPLTVTTPAESTQTPFRATPFTPGQTVEAENFDLGGEGVAYHDIDPENRGGSVYRANESVDVGYGGGNFVVGYTAAGEWLEYTFDVPAAGSFRFETRLSGGGGGQMHYEVDGVNVTGSLAVSASGGFGEYSTQVSPTFNLAAGRHVVRMSLDEGSRINGAVANIDSFVLAPIVGDPPPPAQTPFNSRPFNVNELIQAEDFDNGGQGVAYNDADAVNRMTPAYRPEGVDAGNGGTGRVVGFTAAGEWLEYSISIDTPTGTYRIEASVANNAPGARFHFELDGASIGGVLDVPNTGSFGLYQTVSTQPVTLAHDTYVLRLFMDKGAPLHGAVANFDWLRIVPA